MKQQRGLVLQEITLIPGQGAVREVINAYKYYSNDPMKSGPGPCLATIRVSSSRKVRIEPHAWMMSMYDLINLAELVKIEIDHLEADVIRYMKTVSDIGQGVGVAVN